MIKILPHELLTDPAAFLKVAKSAAYEYLASKQYRTACPDITMTHTEILESPGLSRAPAIRKVKAWGWRKLDHLLGKDDPGWQVACWIGRRWAMDAIDKALKMRAAGLGTEHTIAIGYSLHVEPGMEAQSCWSLEFFPSKTPPQHDHHFATRVLVFIAPHGLAWNKPAGHILSHDDYVIPNNWRPIEDVPPVP